MGSDDEEDKDALDAVKDGRAEFADPGLAVLSHFTAAYKELEKGADILIRLDKAMLRDKATHDMEAVKTSGMVGKFASLRAVMEDLHHTLGHLFFDACWSEVNVGEEFNERSSALEQLASLLGAELPGAVVESGMISVNDLVEKLKKQMQEQGERTRNSGPMPEIH